MRQSGEGLKTRSGRRATAQACSQRGRSGIMMRAEAKCGARSAVEIKGGPVDEGDFVRGRRGNRALRLP